MFEFKQCMRRGRKVWVRKDKGGHWDYSLCHRCSKYLPDSGDLSCRVASRLYELCVADDIATAVWECPDFKENKR